jgi:hypothetical protein
MNMHDQVNNAQAPAHQMQSSAEKSAVQGESMKMMDMSGHDQAAMSHEMMQNGNSAAHQDMAEMHKNDEIQASSFQRNSKIIFRNERA